MRLAQLCLERAAELRAPGYNPHNAAVASTLEEIAAVFRREQASELETCPVCGIYVGGVALCRREDCPDPALRKEAKA